MKSQYCALHGIVETYEDVTHDTAQRRGSTKAPESNVLCLAWGKRSTKNTQCSGKHGGSCQPS
jgi:hypothetical protein